MAQPTKTVHLETVGELRAALEGVPDDLAVKLADLSYFDDDCGMRACYVDVCITSQEICLSALPFEVECDECAHTEPNYKRAIKSGWQNIRSNMGDSETWFTGTCPKCVAEHE